MKVNRSELIKFNAKFGLIKSCLNSISHRKSMVKIKQDVVIYWRFSYLLWVIIYLNTAKWACQQQFSKMICHMNCTIRMEGFGKWLWLRCSLLSGCVLTTNWFDEHLQNLQHFIFCIWASAYLTKYQSLSHKGTCYWNIYSCREVETSCLLALGIIVHLSIPFRLVMRQETVCNYLCWNVWCLIGSTKIWWAAIESRECVGRTVLSTARKTSLIGHCQKYHKYWLNYRLSCVCRRHRHVELAHENSRHRTLEPHTCIVNPCTSVARAAHFESTYFISISIIRNSRIFIYFILYSLQEICSLSFPRPLLSLSCSSVSL